MLKDICASTAKHRSTIAEASLRALEVCVDSSRAFRDLFLQTRRPGSTRTETSFFVTGADVVPFETFGPKAEEMRGQLKLAMMIMPGLEWWAQYLPFCATPLPVRCNEYLSRWFS
jgi:hypothetical protein